MTHPDGQAQAEWAHDTLKTSAYQDLSHHQGKHVLQESNFELWEDPSLNVALNYWAHNPAKAVASTFLHVKVGSPVGVRCHSPLTDPRSAMSATKENEWRKSFSTE